MILSTLLGGLLNEKVKNGLAELDERRRIKVKTIHPSVATLLVPPVSGGQLLAQCFCN